MPLARQMVNVQSEFRRSQHFALRRLYKVSEFRGMGTFSQIAWRMDFDTLVAIVLEI